jgi:putative cardiolipin synthase
MGVLFDDPVLATRVREQFVQLSQPDASYWSYLAADGDVHWLDRGSARTVLVREPRTTIADRALVKVLALLPIESQL